MVEIFDPTAENYALGAEWEPKSYAKNKKRKRRHGDQCYISTHTNLTIRAYILKYTVLHSF